MKLGGWKRVGIVATVAWILGTGIYIYTAAVRTIMLTAVAVSANCRVLVWPSGGDCDMLIGDYLAHTPVWRAFAVIAFVPPLFVWGVGYWIRKGFVDSCI